MLYKKSKPFKIELIDLYTQLYSNKSTKFVVSHDKNVVKTEDLEAAALDTNLTLVVLDIRKQNTNY